MLILRLFKDFKRYNPNLLLKNNKSYYLKIANKLFKLIHKT